MVVFKIKNLVLYTIVKNNYYNSDEKNRQNIVLKYLIREQGIPDDEVIIDSLKKKLRNTFFNNLNQRLKKMKKNKKGLNHFENKESTWLNMDFHFNHKCENNCKGK